ncbi:MAG: glycosyltransferase family 2 protein [Candidatus Hydrogenedentota bacterium]|nr:MAG: glycosyltransferase family 2 protein [Candidatus Hydrogenedentota bacterium]
MYKSHRIAVIIPAYNEPGKTVRVVENIPRDLVDKTIVVNDGSTDSTPRECEEAGAFLLHHERRRGIGAAIRTGFRYALDNNFDILVAMAGNGKDDPKQIFRLVQPLVDEGYDFVQGSRYLRGGEAGVMPAHRRIVTRVYPLLVRLTTGFPATDSTNGFRAFKRHVIEDPRINLDQDWLDDPLEYYLYLKILKIRDFKVKEVPVSKIYPKGVPYHQYTKVRPGHDWIPRLLPLFYLTFGIKK